MVKDTQWPIVYSSEYNINFCGLDEIHSIDAGKWSRIIGYLKGEDFGLFHLSSSLILVVLKKKKCPRTQIEPLHFSCLFFFFLHLGVLEVGLVESIGM